MTKQALETQTDIEEAVASADNNSLAVLPPSNELEKVNTPPTNHALQMLQVIEKAAANPRMNVDKMRELLTMQKELMAIQAEAEFNQAMARLQPALPFITKKGKIAFTDSKNNERNTPYARFEDIEFAIRPLYTGEGFSTSYDTENTPDGRIIVVLTIAHVAGHKRTFRTPAMGHDSSGKKNAIQAIGSTMSYGKRYALTNGFGIVVAGEDDDGKKGGDEGKKPDPFANRVNQQAKGNKAVRGDREIITEANTLKEDLKALRTKKEREELMGGKLGLLRDLESIKRGEVVKTLHAIVAKGEIDAE